jgi:hypothetical protein
VTHRLATASSGSRPYSLFIRSNQAILVRPAKRPSSSAILLGRPVVTLPVDVSTLRSISGRPGRHKTPTVGLLRGPARQGNNGLVAITRH